MGPGPPGASWWEGLSWVGRMVRGGQRAVFPTNSGHTSSNPVKSVRVCYTQCNI